MDSNEILRKIQVIASKLPESDRDERLCTLLLDLRPLIEGEYVPATRNAIFAEIWKHELPHKVHEFLRDKQNYFTTSWLYACHLCSISVDCCIGYSGSDSFLEQKFVPDLASTILQILTKMAKVYTKIEEKLQNNLCGNISWVVMILGKLAENFVFTNILMLSSKYIMQFLMMEDASLSLIALSFLKTLLKGNANVFYQMSESRAHSIIEELTFKLFGTADDNVAKVSISVLILVLEMHPLLLELFSTKRYRGFKTYVSKLQGKGFDLDILKLSSMLEAQTKHLQVSQKEENAAIVIQACYKGYKLRERLQKATIAITLFQRSYRAKVKMKSEKRTQENLEKMKLEHEDAERRKTFMSSKVKQLKTMEAIPAKTVHTFLENLEHEAATKIQAAWIGHKSRKALAIEKPTLKRIKAAVVIQRQIRKWLERCRSKHADGLIGLLPLGLTDERKCELQQVIGNIRNRFPVTCKTDKDFQELHENAFHRLNQHMMGLHQMRRQDERRKGLLAQLSVMSHQLSYAPTDLSKITSTDVDHFASHSAPIIIAAREQHQECVSDQKSSWWKKYQTFDDTFELKAEKSPEEKQF